MLRELYTEVDVHTAGGGGGALSVLGEVFGLYCFSSALNFLCVAPPLNQPDDARCVYAISRDLFSKGQLDFH